MDKPAIQVDKATSVAASENIPTRLNEAANTDAALKIAQMSAQIKELQEAEVWIHTFSILVICC